MGWWIALGVCVILLVVLLFSPLGVSLRYNARGFSIHFLAGWIRIPIPVKRIIAFVKKRIDNKEPKAKEPKEEKKPPKEKEPKEKEETKGGSWTDFLPMLKLIPEVLNDLRRKIRVSRLKLALTLAGDDPCDLALNYGRIWASIGNLMPLLDRCFVISRKDISVECDYLATETVVVAQLDVTMTPARMLVLTVRFVVRAVQLLLQIMNSRKGGMNYEPNSSQHDG